MSATPSDMPRKPLPPGARTRSSLEAVIAVLAESIEADSELDLDTVATLSQFVRSVAALTQAQADHTAALNVRHAALRAEG